MVSKAVVKKILDGESAEIEVQRQSACGGECGKCKGCSAPTERIKAVAVNELNANEGDIVTVEGTTGKILKMAAIVYIIPIFLFIAFYVLGSWVGSSETVSVMLSLFGFAIGIGISVLYNRYIKKNGQIVFKIVKKG